SSSLLPTHLPLPYSRLSPSTPLFRSFSCPTTSPASYRASETLSRSAIASLATRSPAVSGSMSRSSPSVRRSRSASAAYPSGERRSEEHTSELQSPDHLVCLLRRQKKK